jgi:hypothetical protein
MVADDWFIYNNIHDKSEAIFVVAVAQNADRTATYRPVLGCRLSSVDIPISRSVGTLSAKFWRQTIDSTMSFDGHIDLIQIGRRLTVTSGSRSSSHKVKLTSLPSCLQNRTTAVPCCIWT